MIIKTFIKLVRSTKALLASVANFDTDETEHTALGQFLYRVGLQAEYTIICALRCVKALSAFLKLLIKKAFFKIFSAVKSIVHLILGDFFKPFSLIKKAILTFIKDFLVISKVDGTAKAFKHMWLYFFSGTVKHLPSVKAQLNYLLPFAAFAVFYFVVQSMLSFNFVLQVSLGEKIVGYVENEVVFENAEALINGRLHSSQHQRTFAIEPGFNLTAGYESGLLSAEELADSIIEASSTDIQMATGILINNELYGVVSDKAAIEAALSALKKPYEKPENTALRVTFVKSVELIDGLYFTDSIKSTESVVNELTGQTEGEQLYRVQKGDSPSSIAARFNIPLKNLYSLNPHMNDGKYKMPIGDELIISKAVNFLQVQTIERSVYTVPIKHEVKKSNSDELQWGFQKTIVKGSDGTLEREVDLVSIEGITVEEIVLRETILQEPVTEEIVVGTKNLYGGAAGAASTGNCIWPAPGYKGVSRGFGPSGHRGLDITGALNTPLLALDNAIVEYAGKGTGPFWSYGNYIKLRHSNGMVSIYAHCNSLAVGTGQYVGKGQVIAYMGSTGRSTGVHLHLEIHVGGALQDPYVYVKRP